MLSVLISAGLYFCPDAVVSNFKPTIYCQPNQTLSCGINQAVKFLLYTRDNPDEPEFLLPFVDQTLKSSNFNSKNPTVLFVHGFRSSAYKRAPSLIRKNYLKRSETNIILVNWELFARGPNYCDSVKMIPTVAYQTVRLLNWLNLANPTLIPNLHLIGFSLGAHVCALVSHGLRQVESQTIRRITGLDPAAPVFTRNTDPRRRLDATDADFVDIIHTNTALLGIAIPIGHVDFYVNGGKRQPHCHFPTKDVCSHRYALEIYSESILKPHEFPAVACKHTDFNQCEPSSTNYLGIHADRQPGGIYLVKTGWKPQTKGKPSLG